jgi:hypothetical protein
MSSISLQLQSVSSQFDFSNITPADAISAATTLYSEGKMSLQDVATLDNLAGQFGNIYGQTSGAITDASDPEKMNFYQPVEAAAQFYGSGSVSASSASSSSNLTSSPSSASSPSATLRVSPYDHEALYSNLLASMEAAQSPAAYAGATINVST